MNDKKVAEGRIERTQPMLFSLDDAADVGIDEGTPVTEDYTAQGSAFTGKILKVKVDVKEMGAGVKAEATKAGAEAAKKISRSRSSRWSIFLLLRGHHKNIPKTATNP